ncbi:hypothetical protein BJ165DRAFT_1570207 [Panaeolus papilionaceus]|nr:hypothetical protein BJ165DRAFT_1570207 [Panaeolus papilionaceus]
MSIFRVNLVNSSASPNSSSTSLNTAKQATSLLTRNPFLIFRLVLLAILSNLAFLTLIFSSWNISVARSSNVSVPGSSAFIVFESALVFLCVTLALLDFFKEDGKMSRVLVECLWTGVLSLIQVGAAIASTIAGPAMSCHSDSTWGVCASTLLLVPSTWISSILFLMYFLALFITAMAHKRTCADFWIRSIYSIDWFGQPETTFCKEKMGNGFCGPFGIYYDDVESGHKRQDSAPWAQTNIVRRGVDQPFAKKPMSGSSSPAPALALPSFPNAVVSPSTSKSHDRIRDSTEKPFLFMGQIPRTASFPPAVADVDQPIPLPRLSEWVRADALRGITVHTNPHSANTP